MKALFLSADARCQHDVINEINTGCAICDWEKHLSKKELPFDVRYLGTKVLEKDKVYTVRGIIMEGSIGDGPIPGLLLENEGGGLVDGTFDMALFSTTLEP